MNPLHSSRAVEAKISINELNGKVRAHSEASGPHAKRTKAGVKTNALYALHRSDKVERGSSSPVTRTSYSRDIDATASSEWAVQSKHYPQLSTRARVGEKREDPPLFRSRGSSSLDLRDLSNH